MKHPENRSPERGFTLVEILVVIAVTLLAVTLMTPALQKLILRNKLEGTARELSTMIQRARLEAVKRASPAVVMVDPGNAQLFAFVDRNGATMSDPPDGIFNPVAGQPEGATDLALGRWSLPERVTLAAPGGGPAIDGLTTVGANQVVLLTPNGTVADIGGYRFGDAKGNYLEVRIEPQATARVTVRKWDGTAWWERGEGGHPWIWE